MSQTDPRILYWPLDSAFGQREAETGIVFCVRSFGAWSFDSGNGLSIKLPEALQDRKPTEYAWGWSITANAQ